MRDFENSFDAALAGVDRTIVEVMGLCAQFTSGAQCGTPRCAPEVNCARIPITSTIVLSTPARAASKAF